MKLKLTIRHTTRFRWDTNRWTTYVCVAPMMGFLNGPSADTVDTMHLGDWVQFWAEANEIIISHTFASVQKTTHCAGGWVNRKISIATFHTQACASFIASFVLFIFVSQTVSKINTRTKNNSFRGILPHYHQSEALVQCSNETAPVLLLARRVCGWCGCHYLHMSYCSRSSL